MNWTDTVDLPHLADVPFAATAIVLVMMFVIVRMAIVEQTVNGVISGVAALAMIAVFGVFLPTAPLWLALAAIPVFIGIGLNGLFR